VRGTWAFGPGPGTTACGGETLKKGYGEMKHLKKVTKPSKAAIWEWPAQVTAVKQAWINEVSDPAPEANPAKPE